VGNSDDTVYGGSGDDQISANNGGDALYGGSGNDIIYGGDGKDNIVGGYGADTLSGGLANDTFTYLSVNDSWHDQADIITDFDRNNDQIDLTAFAPGVGQSAFTAVLATGVLVQLTTNTVGTQVAANTIAWFTNGSNQVIVYANPTDDPLKIGDFGLLEIHLAGISTISLSDFVTIKLAPAGAAGEPINLGLAAASADDGAIVTTTIAGAPSGWTVNGGTLLDDGTWAVQTTDSSSLAITSPTDFAGAVVLNVTETWTQADGSTATITLADNVEVYPVGSPIIALSGDDYLTASSGQDLFVFAQPIGNDVIYGFDATQDQIDLVGYTGFASFNDVTSHLSTDAKGNAVITLADGQSITLSGVAAASLSTNNFVFDQTPLTNNAGTMTIGDGAILPLSGVINNTGTIAVDSAGKTTTLELVQHGITLEGGGHLTLSDSDQNLISASASGVTLTNLDNTISGAGQIGDWQMTLENSGTIIANGTHALLIDTGSNAVVNSGTLEATGSGGLFVNSDISNSGQIWANGGNITINGAVTGTGSALISGASILEFDAASSVNVSFAGTDYGKLILDNPTAYIGQIFGFTGTDAQHSDLIDLKGMTFDAGTSWTYYDNSGSNTGGTLTIFETINSVSTAVVTLKFGDGNYTLGSFKLASDGQGGTLIADPPVESGDGHSASLTPDLASDHFHFGYVDTPPHTLLHVPPPMLGNEGDGLHTMHVGALVTGFAESIGSHASDPFVFNSAFSQNGTSHMEAAQVVTHIDQTLFQTVTDVLTHAAQAAPEAFTTIDHAVVLATELEQHKPPPDLFGHG
jgi:hypothetical protein